MNQLSGHVFASSDPPLPHLSDGLAGGSLNWVPMATARLAARAALFPDAVWKWQGSQKATSEHRLCQGFLCVWLSACQLPQEVAPISAHILPWLKKELSLMWSQYDFETLWKKMIGNMFCINYAISVASVFDAPSLCFFIPALTLDL